MGITIIAFLFVLGVLVFVHEFGHFLAAKKLGVCVETFSIGMGPKLLTKKYGDTEYCLSAIPLGGYVKLKGENPDEAPTGTSDELMSKSIPARFAIFFAGPAMNLIAAVIFVAFVYIIGIQMPKYLDEPPVVQWVSKESPAQKSGMQIGDLIRNIGGTDITTWEQAELLILSSTKKPFPVEVNRGNQFYTLELVPKVEESYDVSEIIGIDHSWKPVITGLSKGFPAEKAGVKPGDEITSIDGVSISHWRQAVEIIRAYSGTKPLEFTVLRDGKPLTFSMTPQSEEGQPRLGIMSDKEVFEGTSLKQYGVVESLSRSVQKCVEMTWLTIDFLKRLVTRQASTKSIGGPIMIAQLSGEVAKRGVSELFIFMGMVSLNLGIVNLLPIPILDGGHIFLLLIEFLNRKPLSMKKREIFQIIGLVILIPLFIFVFYNDIARILGW